MTRILCVVVAVALTALYSYSSSAQNLAKSAVQIKDLEHKWVERVAVFPIQTDSAMESVADDSWWQIREELTKQKRFLVSSRQFLIKKDAFQPRGLLEPADAILLGKLLDAHALVVSFLKERELTMAVYDGADGSLLWQNSLKLHASLPREQQLSQVARQLTGDFIASIPYQAKVRIDPVIGRAVYEEGDVILTQIYAGETSALQDGDPVQWLEVTHRRTAPVFQGGARVQVLAEGQIVSCEGENCVAQITHSKERVKIVENALVRLPKESERLRSQYLMPGQIRNSISSELIMNPQAPLVQQTKEQRPAVTTMSFLGSLAAMVLLAF